MAYVHQGHEGYPTLISTYRGDASSAWRNNFLLKLVQESAPLECFRALLDAAMKLMDTNPLQLWLRDTSTCSVDVLELAVQKGEAEVVAQVGSAVACAVCGAHGQ